MRTKVGKKFVLKPLIPEDRFDEEAYKRWYEDIKNRIHELRKHLDLIDDVLDK